MSFAIDPVLLSRALPRRKRFDYALFLSCLAVAAFSLFMFHWEYGFENADLYTHARIAGEFDFTDLHSITSRLAYPLWHVFVSALYQLGMPLVWASAVVCAACKVGGMLLTHRLVRVLAGEDISRGLVTLAAFLLMFVTGICIPSINRYVYRPIGSPTVWHNPTQLAVIVTMLLCVPYTVHCWYAFARKRDAGEARPMLPWVKVVALAALLMLSLAAKPTFLQALIPAAAVFFLVEWVRNPRHWRFFLQMILAYLPSVLYFLLQYLYYTGVVVPYTSGVQILITDVSLRETLRNVLMMNAFPLFAIVCCYRKGMFRDRQLVLCLLMLFVSALEAMTFRETGMRDGHGNFFWAGMSVSLMLWIHMLSVYMREAAAFLKAPRRPALRWAGYGAGLALMLWHFGSGFYYLYSILSRGASF